MKTSAPSGQGQDSRLAALVDISAVRSDSSRSDISDLMSMAGEHGFVSAHVLPHWVEYARNLRADNSALKIGSPVGYPSGGTFPHLKQQEAEALLAAGVDELDVVANCARLLSGDLDYVREDLEGVVRVAAGRVPVRAIFECHYLDETQLRIACDLAVASGADYIKTGTGWAESGATLSVVQTLLDQADNRIAVKAAGGVRELDTVLKMIDMGVSRFGINTGDAVRLVAEYDLMREAHR